MTSVFKFTRFQFISLIFAIVVASILLESAHSLPSPGKRGKGGLLDNRNKGSGDSPKYSLDFDGDGSRYTELAKSFMNNLKGSKPNGLVYDDDSSVDCQKLSKDYLTVTFKVFSKCSEESPKVFDDLKKLWIVETDTNDFSELLKIWKDASSKTKAKKIAIFDKIGTPLFHRLVDFNRQKVYVLDFFTLPRNINGIIKSCRYDMDVVDYSHEKEIDIKTKLTKEAEDSWILSKIQTSNC